MAALAWLLVVTAATATTVLPRVVRGTPASLLQNRGALRAANRGWLILSPTREPSSATSCGTLRAVNIETGFSFQHDDCAGRVWSGRVPPDEARAAMRALLSGDLGTGREEAGNAAGIWRWVVSEDENLIGDLRSISGSGTSAGPVRRLLQELDTLRPDTCAPPLPPPAQALVATLPKMINAVSADESQELTVRYRRAREQWARLRACEP